MATQWATTGAAQGSGDGSSEANRIELKKVLEDDAALASALAAGDTINCKDDGQLDYDGSAGTFATLAVSGTATARIFLQGYTTTAGDGGGITINDTDAGATNNCFTMTTRDFWTFAYIELIDVRTGFSMGTRDGHRFFEIRVTVSGSNTSGAAFFRGSAVGDPCEYANCYVDGKENGWDDSGRGGNWVNCSAVNCTNAGFISAGIVYGPTFIHCVAHACGTNGFEVTGSGRMYNCASNQNTTDGYLITDTDSPTTLINCWATSNGGFGLNASFANTHVTSLYSGLNPTNETNTSGKSGGNVTLIEIAEITGDPVYTDGNPGTDTDVDLSLASTSSGKAASLPRHTDETHVSYLDVGPIQRQEPAGGGGVAGRHIGLLPITKISEVT